MVNLSKGKIYKHLRDGSLGMSAEVIVIRLIEVKRAHSLCVTPFLGRAPGLRGWRKGTEQLCAFIALCFLVVAMT